MTAIRLLGILIASLALCGIAEAQKGGGKPGGKNTPPTGSISDISVTVNSPDTVIDLYAAYSDAQDPDTALAYAVTGNTNPTLFNSVTIDSVNGTLTLSYATDAVGVADITVTVTDTGGKSITDLFQVSVSSGVLFLEEFSHRFNEAWTSEPSELHIDPQMWYRGARTNRGSTSIQFEPSGIGADLLNRVTTNFSNYGQVSLATFSANVDVYARIKTPQTYGPGTIDGLFNLLLINANDRTKFVSVGINGGSGSGEWCYHDWIDEQHPIWAWQTDTWYRLKISESAEFGVEVSVWNDEMTQMIHSHRFSYALTEIGTQFNVAFTQNLDALGVSMPVFIDFIMVLEQ